VIKLLFSSILIILAAALLVACNSEEIIEHVVVKEQNRSIAQPETLTEEQTGAINKAVITPNWHTLTTTTILPLDNNEPSMFLV